MHAIKLILLCYHYAKVKLCGFGREKINKDSDPCESPEHAVNWGSFMREQGIKWNNKF